MQDVIDALADIVASSRFANIAAPEAESCPAVGADAGLYLGQVFFVTGGKVVKADDVLIKLQQGFDQVAANEASNASYEPGFGLSHQRFFQRVERGHHNLQSAKPAALTVSGS